MNKTLLQRATSLRRITPRVGRAARGSLLFEMVIALSIFAGSAITISGVVVRAAQTVEAGRSRVEADDLARSALTLIQIGVISPEAADGLSEHELRGLLVSETASASTASDPEPRFLLTVETQPTDWRSLTHVTVSISPAQSDSVVARSNGLVDLGRIRTDSMREFGP